MKIYKIIFALLILSTTASAWFLPYKNPNNLPYPQFVNLDSKIIGAWDSYKKEYVESNGLIFKDYDSHYSNGTYYSDANDTYKYSVSEGIGYVMLIALYMNDQETFDKVWSAGKSYFGYPTMNSAKWLVKYSKNNVNSVSTEGSGSATDADLDVATALVFASELADKGYWDDNGYSSDANTLVNAIYDKDQSSGWMKLGTDWGGKDQQNLSYFAPAYLRLFDDWQGTSRWNTVINNHYGTLQKNPGYSKGIIRNWCTSTGGVYSPSGTGSDEDSNMGFEAIRVPWRIAVDAIWYNNSDAKEYCNNAMNFAPDPIALGTGMFDATSPYNMNYDPSWLQSTSKAMWGSCSGVVNQDLINNYAEKLSDTYRSYNSTFHEDDQYYFATLTLLGALVSSGSFANVYEDLKNYSLSSKEFICDFSVNADIIDSEIELSKFEKPIFYAKLTQSSNWEITLTSSISGITITESGTGTTPYFQLDKFKIDNKIFRVGETVTVKLMIAGEEKQSIAFIIKDLPTKYTEILVDDFNDSDSLHNLNGEWYPISDKDFGGNSESTYSFEERESDNMDMSINYGIDKLELGNGFSGIEASLSDNGILNLLKISFFSFMHKGDAMRFEILNQNDDKKIEQMGVDIPEHSDWTRVVIINNQFENPNSSLHAYNVLDSISYFRFVKFSENNTSGNFMIDDFILNGEYSVTAGGVAISSKKIIETPNLSIYPNPFNPIVNIRLNNFINKKVSAEIFDVKGRKITSLYKNEVNSNNQLLSWNASRFPTGIYFLRVKSSGIIMNKKLLLIK